MTETEEQVAKLQSAIDLIEGRQFHRVAAPLLNDVILPALYSRLCDLVGSYDPAFGADIFWDEEKEYGHATPLEVVDMLAEGMADGEVVDFELYRAQMMTTVPGRITKEGGNSSVVWWPDAPDAPAHVPQMDAADG